MATKSIVAKLLSSTSEVTKDAIIAAAAGAAPGITEGATEIVRDANGKVGVGSTAPAYTLV